MSEQVKQIEDGGPAFPPTHDPETHPSGMSLRDYFAAKAMQAVLHTLSAPDEESLLRGAFPQAAKYAYAAADAMLEARKASK